MRRLMATAALLIAVLALPALAAAAAPPKVAAEETVLSFRNGEMRFFDQLTLSGTGTLTWPVARGAGRIAVKGGTILARHGDAVVIDARTPGVTLTYAVPRVGETFVWTRHVGTPPGTWVVLVAPGMRVGWVEGLPFVPQGHVKIAGLTLAEYAYTGRQPTTFAWPFLTSGVPQDIAKALWALAGLAVLGGAWLAWRGLDGGRRARQAAGGSPSA